jgi:hypothetical protein
MDMQEALKNALFHWVSVPHLPTTWHLFATTQMLAVYPPEHTLWIAGQPILVHGDLTQRYEVRWDGMKAGTIKVLPPNLLKQVDSRVDLVIGSVFQDATRLKQFAKPGSPEYEGASLLLELCFPRSARAITNLPVIEQLIVVDAINKKLRGELAQVVKTLRLDYWADALDEILPQYRQVVEDSRDADFGFPTLAQAREQGRALLAGHIAASLNHALHTPADAPLVVTSLAAYHGVAERYRIMRGNKRSVPALNPKTGEVTDEQEDAP